MTLASPLLGVHWCDCCAHITRAGETGPRRVLARYLWTCRPSGLQVPLCVDCCACWRANAAEDPDLAPELVESL